MIGEIWTYKATKPSDNLEKARPILIIGNDEDICNLLKCLVVKDIPIINYSRAVGNLEDVFIQITADSDEEEA